MKKKKLTKEKGSGFKLPEDYFLQFENRMIQKIASEEQSGLPEASRAFRVPSGYFEEFETRILQKVTTEPKQPKVIPVFKNLSYVAAVAAVLAVLLTTSIIKSPAEDSYEELNLAAVESYLLETLEMRESTETPFVLEDEENMNWNENTQIDKEALLEYLTENVEEPAILFNAP